MSQTRFTYYFAMTVNGAIFFAGFVMLFLGIWELAGPEPQWQAFVGAGGGLSGVLLNNWLNGPRRHARHDLVALVNVKVVFLGFLRCMNQIDATFKHMYLEAPNFTIADMDSTVSRIRECVAHTLTSMGRHLDIAREKQEPEEPTEPEEPAEPEEPTEPEEPAEPEEPGS